MYVGSQRATVEQSQCLPKVPCTHCNIPTKSETAHLKFYSLNQICFFFVCVFQKQTNTIKFFADIRRPLQEHASQPYLSKTSCTLHYKILPHLQCNFNHFSMAFQNSGIPANIEIPEI